LSSHVLHRLLCFGVVAAHLGCAEKKHAFCMVNIIESSSLWKLSSLDVVKGSGMLLTLNQRSVTLGTYQAGSYVVLSKNGCRWFAVSNRGYRDTVDAGVMLVRGKQSSCQFIMSVWWGLTAGCRGFGGDSLIGWFGSNLIVVGEGNDIDQQCNKRQCSIIELSACSGCSSCR